MMISNKLKLFCCSWHGRRPPCFTHARDSIHVSRDVHLISVEFNALSVADTRNTPFCEALPWLGSSRPHYPAVLPRTLALPQCLGPLSATSATLLPPWTWELLVLCVVPRRSGLGYQLLGVACPPSNERPSLHRRGFFFFGLRNGAFCPWHPDMPIYTLACRVRGCVRARSRELAFPFPIEQGSSPQWYFR